MAPEPLSSGRMLVTTNRRLLAFCRNDGRNETVLTMLEEVQSASVRPAPRRWAAVFKGALLAAAGIAFYLVVAYWLTGRIDGPSVPVINLDVAALALLLGLLGAAWMLGAHYLANEDGSVLFLGPGLAAALPVPGRAAQQGDLPGGEHSLCGPQGGI